MAYVVTTKQMPNSGGSLKAGHLQRGKLYRAFDGSSNMRGYVVLTSSAAVLAVGSADDISMNLTPFETIDNPAWSYEEATGITITIEA